MQQKEKNRGRMFLKSFLLFFAFFLIVGLVKTLLKRYNSHPLAPIIQGSDKVTKAAAEDLIFNKAEGWVRLVDADQKTFVEGKIAYRHKDDLYFGYGYLNEKNLPDKFINDLRSEYSELKGATKILVRFGIDAQTSNAFVPLTKPFDNQVEVDQAIATNQALPRVYLSSVELGLPQTPEDKSNFDKLWAEAINPSF